MTVYTPILVFCITFSNYFSGECERLLTAPRYDCGVIK